MLCFHKCWKIWTPQSRACLLNQPQSPLFSSTLHTGWLIHMYYLCWPYRCLYLLLFFQTHKEEKYFPNCPWVCKPASPSVELVLHIITTLCLIFSLNSLLPLKQTFLGIVREVQKGGDISIPMADSCWCLTETNIILRAIILQKTNKNKLSWLCWHFKTPLLGTSLGGPVVKAPPSDAGGTGSIHSQGIKIPHAELLVP